MNETRVTQWLGMICLLAGISRMGMTPSAFIWGTDSTPELIFGIVASVLMSVGTIAIFMVQSRETGVLGLISVLAISVGNIATACMLWSLLQAANQPISQDGLALTVLHLLILIGLTGGTLAFTVLAYRAKVFPRWVIVLLVMMPLSMFLPVEDNKYIAFFWGLSYVGMGYTIWSGTLRAKRA
ncbi:hypothetical protein [Paenibacillus ginsengarvi]|uniref:Uncharacterized protein n=1 Tax=Paenibacillus ginsengarvi TaxID=400777 RepID=A0A3B0B1G4_9BACL|nr:hypothetical protein [Paenibacillus ginsengarvi]RKN66039.1 hypothetical protein D7M11_31690 [Paenibacillus ginsengarvi]